MKARIKKIIQTFSCRMNILSIYILLTRALSKSKNSKYAAAYALDVRVVAALFKLNTKYLAKQRSKLMRNIARYIGNITKTVILERDEVEDNERISLYLELLEKHYFDGRGITATAIANFVDAMVMALATEKRRHKAIEVFEKNEYYLTDTQKAKLFISWMAVVGAKLPIPQCIVPLLNHYPAQIAIFEGARDAALRNGKTSEAYKEESEMINLTSRIFSISQVVDVPVVQMDTTIRHLFESSSDASLNSLLNLAINLARNEGYHKMISEWIQEKNLDQQNLQGTQQRKLSFLKEALESTRKGARIPAGIISSNNFIYEMIQRVEVSVLRSKTKTPSQKLMILKLYLFMLRVMFVIVLKFGLKITVANQIVRTKKALKYLESAKVYWSSLNAIIPQSKGDTLFVHVGLSFGPSAHHSFPLLLEAKRRGNLITGIHQNAYTYFGESQSDLLSISKNTLGFGDIRYLRNSPRKYKWEIDVANKRVIADGINLYQPIFDRVARWQFSYFMFYETDAAAKYLFKMSVDAYDLVLENCEEYERWAVKNNYKIRFVSDVSHLYPEAGYMFFCEAYKGPADMKYIQVGPGYEDYFKNKEESVNETLAGLNMTDNPNSRLPQFGTKEMFEKYYSEHTEEIPLWQEKAKKWFNYQRSSAAKNLSEDEIAQKQAILNLIESYKKQGKKVYMASGKLVFDLAVKYTKGCAHDDMSDWITHTVETVKKNPDILLLIKPHPHETRKEITMSSEIVGTIADLIKTDLGDNTILLHGSWFRNIDLINYIDVEFTWGGTSSLEFQSQGIKTMMADEWAHKDYPIGFIKVDSREEYERFINHPEEFETPKDLPERALMFLAFMCSDDVLMKNRYTETMGNNYGIHKSKINVDAVQDYAKNGDENLARFYDRLV